MKPGFIEVDASESGAKNLRVLAPTLGELTNERGIDIGTFALVLKKREKTFPEESKCVIATSPIRTKFPN